MCNALGVPVRQADVAQGWSVCRSGNVYALQSACLLFQAKYVLACFW